MSLRKFINISTLLLCLIGVVLWLCVFYLAHFTREIDAKFRTAGREIVLLQKVQTTAFLHRNRVLRSSIVGLPRNARELIANVEQDLISQVDRMEQVFSKKAGVPELRDAIFTYLDAVHDVDADEEITAEEHMKIFPLFENIENMVNKLRSEQLSIAASLEREIRTRSEQFRNWSLLLLFSLIGIFAFVAILLKKYITEPCTRISDVIGTIKKGEFEMIDEGRGPMEFKQIAFAWNKMSRDLRRQRENQVAFLAAVAHDLKNPIGAIQMSTDLLTKRCPDHLISVIRRQASHMNRLVTDLLEATNVNVGTLTIDKHVENIVPLLDDCAELYRSTSRQHSIQVEKPSSSVFLECDRSRFQQVLNNLISNAIKYSPRGGEVKIQLSETDGEVSLSVSDQGIGIRKQDFNRIFEPFERARSKLSKEIPGIGLGLFTVKKIISAHNGRIFVKSEEGKGTTFTVVFPKLSAALIPSREAV